MAAPVGKSLLLRLGLLQLATNSLLHSCFRDCQMWDNGCVLLTSCGSSDMWNHSSVKPLLQSAAVLKAQISMSKRKPKLWFTFNQNACGGNGMWVCLALWNIWGPPLPRLVICGYKYLPISPNHNVSQRDDCISWTFRNKNHTQSNFLGQSWFSESMPHLWFAKCRLRSHFQG